MERHVIDRSALNELLETTGNDPAFLAELVDTYLVDSVALLATMQQAVRGDDASQLRRAAHSLKSSSASFGARALVALCQELEDRANMGALDDALTRLGQVEAAFAEVERELRTLRPAT